MSETIGQVASVVTAAGVLFAAGQLFASGRQRKSEFAQAYISRFWSIIDERIEEADGTHYAWRYLQLCEDEYEVAALGFIDSRTWPVWHSAIRTELQSRADAAVVNVLNEAEPDVFLLTRERLAAQDPDHKAWRCPAFTGFPARDAAASMLCWNESLFATKSWVHWPNKPPKAPLEQCSSI